MLVNKKSHSPKIYYWTQADVNPPKFVLTTNNPNHFHFSYKRYLVNFLRKKEDFEGTPIVFIPRKKGEKNEEN